MIVNRFIPFKGFYAINLCGIIFVREGSTLSIPQQRHEYIHSRQIVEMLVIGFYVWYLVEWLVHLVRLRNSREAYYAISFEREAYAHQNHLGYLRRRKHFAWFRYL
jgi:hypothetical protein